jgi:FkbM family methyltransferase
MIRKAVKFVLNKLGYSLQKLKVRKGMTGQLAHILGFIPEGDTYEFLYDGLSFLNNLKEKGAHFSLREDKLSVEIEDLIFFINTWEELFILDEIFAKGIYDISLNEEFALIDIGMNVGFSSLYFANKNNCKRIFSYEPVHFTLQLARKNLCQNACSHKIEIFDKALGYPQREIEVYYAAELKGSTGLYGISLIDHPHSSAKRISLNIDDVSFNLKKHFYEYSGKFIAKIDCEGCEYEIIERLEESGILNRVSIYLIEWHKKGPNRIKNILTQNGYYVLTLPDNDKTRGIIYAFLKSEENP